MKHLVLLGGGHAHLHVLRALAQRPLAGARVTLVSPFPGQTYSGMVPGVLAGRYAPDDCVIPLARLAASAGAERIESAAVGLDAAQRRVMLANGQGLDYDTLSVDTGPVMDRDAIPGAREHALFVRPIEHFLRLWSGLLALAHDRVLDVVVVGGGAGGIEIALALQHRLGERARLTLVTGGAPPLAGHAAGAQRRVRRALARRAVALFEDTCTAIGPTHLQLGCGSRLRCDAPLLAIGTRAPAWPAGSGLALDPQGFIATGASLQSTSHPEVFAVGDVASRIDAPRPKSGVYAVRAGPPLLENLRRWLAGARLREHRPPRRALSLLACGDRHAIASWGAWSGEGRWVWWWKDRIDRAFVAGFRSGSP